MLGLCVIAYIRNRKAGWNLGPYLYDANKAPTLVFAHTTGPFVREGVSTHVTNSSTRRRPPFYVLSVVVKALQSTGSSS